MITFDTPDLHRHLYDGEQRIWNITDRISFSAISNYFSVGGRQGLWEIWVIKDGRVSMNHPLTGKGNLHLSEVIQILEDFQESLSTERQPALS